MWLYGTRAGAHWPKAESPVPAEQFSQVMKILDGIYRSQEAGCEVRLD